MSLTLNTNEARQADRVNSAIKETGKYVGVITRAEKLLSKQNTQGVGISFKSDDGATANYLDLYTVNGKGENLPSNQTVNAILCCTKTKEAAEGKIDVEKWDSESKQTYKAKVDGYPVLMGKRIGLLLQRELSNNPKNPEKHNDRVVIVGVFEADTEFTASEILDKATKPEKLAKMVQALKPVNDRRTNQPAHSHSAPQATGDFDDFDNDLPF